MTSKETDKIIYTKADLQEVIEKLPIVDSEFKDLFSDFLENAIYIYNNRDVGEEDAVTEVVDVALEYNYEKWLIIEHYCDPDDCNYNYALNEFIDDLTYALDSLIVKQED